ncbi:MAG: hypothetical protein HUJ25_06570 [Crocinitomicaceae bacterium]|nr:hypothetical protein [Crocinitomicaceae bacterium]
MKFILFIGLLSSFSLAIAQSPYNDPDTRYIDSLTSVALQYELNNDESFVQSLDHFYKAFEFIETKDEFSEARALLYSQFVLFNYRTGNYDEVIHYGRSLMEINESSEYTGQIFSVYQYMGKAYLKLGEVENAIDIEKRGIELSIKNFGKPNNTSIYHFMYNELGLTYLWSGQYDLAIESFYKSLNSGWDFNAHFTFVLLENIADATIKKGDLPAARILLDSLKIHPGRSEHIRREINYLILEAEYNIAKGNLKLADSYATQAKDVLSNSVENHDDVLWNRILDVHIKYYILKNDQKGTSAMILRKQLFNDSISLIHQRNSLITRNLFYEKTIENKDLKIKNAELEISANRAKLKQEEYANKNRILLIISLSLVLIIILLIVLRVIRKRAVTAKLEKTAADIKLLQSINEKRVLEKTIENKEKDISALSNYLLSSSVQINDLKVVLKRINAISNPEEKEELLLDFMISTKNKIRHIQEQETILKHIDQVNDKFFNQLSKQHPDLTKTEILICGLIRAGYSNDQIATEKNTTVNSVKTSKTRIKKKLKIEKSIKLDTYIKGL